MAPRACPRHPYIESLPTLWLCVYTCLCKNIQYTCTYKSVHDGAKQARNHRTAFFRLVSARCQLSLRTGVGVKNVPPWIMSPRTLFTGEYCPPGHYSLVNIVPPPVKDVPHERKRTKPSESWNAAVVARFHGSLRGDIIHWWILSPPVHNYLTKTNLKSRCVTAASCDPALRPYTSSSQFAILSYAPFTYCPP